MSAADYDWLTLEANEAVRWTGAPTLLGYAWALVLGVALVPLFGAGLVVLVATYLHVRHTEYVITTDAVYEKTGVLSRTVVDVGHENVQDTGYRQGVVGRLFGFGTVRISTAGGSGVELSLAHVPDPLAVQSQLDRVATAAGGRERDGRRPVEVDPDTLEELVEEMRATRTALESIERRLTEE